VTDFVNLKIKSAQSFECDHKSRMYICVYRDEYSYIYVFILCLKKDSIEAGF
jgi:hypothetical protein